MSFVCNNDDRDYYHRLIYTGIGLWEDSALWWWSWDFHLTLGEATQDRNFHAWFASCNGWNSSLSSQPPNLCKRMTKVIRGNSKLSRLSVYDCDCERVIDVALLSSTRVTLLTMWDGRISQPAAFSNAPMLNFVTLMTVETWCFSELNCLQWEFVNGLLSLGGRTNLDSILHLFSFIPSGMVVGDGRWWQDSAATFLVRSSLKHLWIPAQMLARHQRGRKVHTVEIPSWNTHLETSIFFVLDHPSSSINP